MKVRLIGLAILTILLGGAYYQQQTNIPQDITGAIIIKRLECESAAQADMYTIRVLAQNMTNTRFEDLKVRLTVAAGEDSTQTVINLDDITKKAFIEINEDIMLAQEPNVCLATFYKQENKLIRAIFRP